MKGGGGEGEERGDERRRGKRGEMNGGKGREER